MTDPTTDTEGTPMTDRPPRRLTRQRDCDLATSHDLKALDDCGIPYEIVETGPQATILRFDILALARFRAALTHDSGLERDLTNARRHASDLQDENNRLRQRLQRQSGAGAA